MRKINCNLPEPEFNVVEMKKAFNDFLDQTTLNEHPTTRQLCFPVGISFGFLKEIQLKLKAYIYINLATIF